MLSVYSLNESEKWDQIVHTFRGYDAYYLSGYVKAFEIHGDGEPLLFYYEDESVKGINVVMRRDIAQCTNFAGKFDEGKYFDFATPYGYGGWLVEGEDTKLLFEEYEAWCKKNKIISEFVRFHPMAGNHAASEGWYEVIPLGETVAMDLSSPEIIWGNLTGKNRNKIRKAIKNGIKIYNGRYPEIYKEFRSIYNETMKKDYADKYYYFETEFYESINEDLSKNAQVFYARIPDGTIIAAAIILTANGRVNYHLSGSMSEYAQSAAMNLLLFQVALWGCENGYKEFYLGGGVGAAEDSLLKFKKSFYRGELKKFYIGKKIYNQEIYNSLVELRSKNMFETAEKEYFPEYRR